jgi:hypothetical protein
LASACSIGRGVRVMEGVDMAVTSWKRALEEASALKGRLGLNGR